MMAILSILGTRSGGVGALVAIGVLAIVSSALGLSLWLTRSDLADAQANAARLEAAVTEQNAAVERMRNDAAAASQAASARAVAALKPRPKPDLKTAEDLNSWLASP
ncbi:hypothetical protein [Azospirillum picis]|uniref:Uncharacterized protein n=1 Tax=Azospirillum picis TaxID=488438 RepID=A0ABU0MSP4_9PROT|nr:hypothetical protein [Azospirillum picis]MBP2302828.1 hypothetical protein [Azospirillum picis]MDQ0536510.1 hypothetical protein [Azospirillum picis]